MSLRPASLLLAAGLAAGGGIACGGRARAASPFDADLEARVVSEALGFMAPRILDPVTVGQLAQWGLGGIAALDPSMQAAASGRALVLSTATAPAIWRGPLPAASDSAAWGAAAAAICAAAFRASPQVAEAGQTGVTQSFFDELFNHLDPYSRYVAPAPATAERDRLDGAGGGIGASLIETGRGLELGDIAPDGPAADAGLATGERLLRVDDTDVRGLSGNAAVALLDGPVGSTVTLRIRAEGRVLTVPLVREAVPPETVFGTSADGLLLLRITGFARDTAEELSALLDAGLRDRPRGLIIDLRGNRGGFLQQAVTASALFLDNGVATVTEGRYPQSNHVWSVQGGDVTHGTPLVVLVDGRTASAAEILASALADHRRAAVVGSSTLGKGLVQTLLPLPDGGELFVTWSRVLAPLGWPLQGLGVLPQLCTSEGAASVADQMRALDGGGSLLAGPIAAERGSRSPLAIARILDIRNACPAAIGTDEDLDAARNLLADPTAYAAALGSVPPLD